MLPQQRFVLPLPLSNKLLHGLDIAALQGQGHRFNRFPLDGQQQPLQVLVAPMGLFVTVVQIRKRRVVVHQFLCQRRNLWRCQVQRWRCLVDLNNPKVAHMHALPLPTAGERYSISRQESHVVVLATSLNAPRLIRLWRRRRWIEHGFRTLTHLLATEACQVQSEDASYGHLVLRLMGCFIVSYTARVICQGALTMEEIVFSLKHDWRFVDSEVLELQGLSWGSERKVA
jgi:hypothetical protein